MIMDSTQALCLVALHGSVTIVPRALDREELTMIEKASAHDETAYRWLLARYRDRVVRVAAATLGSTSEAEDAAQEAFIRAFRSLKALDRKSSFYSWLCRIVVRVCLDRKRLRRSSEMQIDIVECNATSNDCSAPASTRLLVWQLLNQLPPPMRAALVLRELDGLDYDEISTALHIPIGTVRSRLNAARQRFKSLWEEATDEMEEPVHVNHR